MMDALTWMAAAALGLSLLPLLLGLMNLALYRRPKDRLGQAAPPGTAVSVLIPARDEAATIEGAVRCALASEGIEIEVVVLDDHSTDATADIVARLVREDARVRLEQAPPLPPGWSGKQHACHLLARHARHPVLLFQDADVRLSPGGVAAIAEHLLARDAALVSGFPRQETRTAGEKLLVPMMLFLLIGYLPLIGMRLTRYPIFAAACGQLIALRRDAYERAGGHAAIRTSLHDGLKLPKAFRAAGFMTDLLDATDLASCRMYRGWRETWHGFSKNAAEGMATPVALPVWTVLLFGGHILPWVLLLSSLAVRFPPAALALAAAAAAAGIAFRLLLAARFRTSLLGALLHPVGVTLTLAIQWRALAAARQGRPAEWRGRQYNCG